MSAKDFYTPEQPVMSLVEAVCVRPSMYTLNGTWEEAAAFLYGFHSGMAAHNRSKGAMRQVGWWNNFCDWACEQVGSEQGGWYVLCQALRHIHSDNAAAFAHLAALCIQYWQAREASLI